MQQRNLYMTCDSYLITIYNSIPKLDFWKIFFSFFKENKEEVEIQVPLYIYIYNQIATQYKFWHFLIVYVYIYIIMYYIYVYVSPNRTRKRFFNYSNVPTSYEMGLIASTYSTRRRVKFALILSPLDTHIAILMLFFFWFFIRYLQSILWLD